MNARGIKQSECRREAVLLMANQGWDQREIALALGITDRQVRSYLAKLVETGRRIAEVRADGERLREELEVA